ncbi:MAG: hypothetical protein J6S49_06460, partial [Erysipelotrichaceae bacterium]|nr:hypothetical protein [Erysipelotrichaceae bacterium]
KEKLPLDQMKSEPGTSLGLRPDFKNQNALQFILMGLRQYQPDGLCFIETGLQSVAVMTRNQALNVLESWVTDNKKPLSELLPQIYSLLVKLHEIEPDENTRKRMDCLINGDTVFRDGTEYFDED